MKKNFSKLRLIDHRVGGCPCGFVNSNGSRWELHVYPNLKIAKLDKELKLILQRGDGIVWENFHDNSVWLDLNPELKDAIYLLRSQSAEALVHGAHTRDIDGFSNANNKMPTAP